MRREQGSRRGGGTAVGWGSGFKVRHFNLDQQCGTLVGRPRGSWLWPLESILSECATHPWELSILGHRTQHTKGRKDKVRAKL